MPFLDARASTPVVKSATNHSTADKKMDGKKSMGLVKSAVIKLEKRMSEAMEGVDPVPPAKRSPTSSAEVSPPESGTITPRVTIQPCPARLTPLVPPKNFGAVESGTIYRSGFPEPHNVEFLEKLKLRTILTLVETEAESEIHIFASLYDIKRVTVPIIANKEGEIRTTHDSLCEAILVAMNPLHHPLHIHCNRGKHRTGCIVACIRKIQRWPIEEVLAEYDTYASPKARPEDIELIKNFDPASVYEYAKERGLVECWPRESRIDSATDIFELAAALPPHALVETPSPSTISDVGDDDLMMTGAVIDPTRVTYALDTDLSTADGNKSPHPEETTRPEVTVAELDDEDVIID